MLDFSNLEKAINNLEYWLHEIQNNLMMINASDRQKNGFRAGLIQYYEVAYELSYKMIKRYLNENVNNGYKWEKDILRSAQYYELIDDMLIWIEYTNFRNDTSHEYDEEKSDALVSIIPRFIIDASNLLENLKKYESLKQENIDEIR